MIQQVRDICYSSQRIIVSQPKSIYTFLLIIAELTGLVVLYWSINEVFLFSVPEKVSSPTLIPPKESSNSSLLPSSIRYVLIPEVKAFHGSSAMQSLLRSSPNVTTLCNMKAPGEIPIWQCEPNAAVINWETLKIIATRNEWKKRKKYRKYQKQTKDVPQRRVLRFFAQFWNLSKPILFCKFCGLGTAVIEGDALPDEYKIHGITQLIPARIVMWRPFCLETLANERSFVENEVKRLEEKVKLLNTLTQNDVRHIVVGLDELTWNPFSVASRIFSMLNLPGLVLDSAFTPKEKDSKQKNQTIGSFGLKHDPKECCDFNITTRSCGQRGMAKMRSPLLTKRYLKAESFLRSYHSSFEI